MTTKTNKQDRDLERALSHLPGIEPSLDLGNKILADAEAVNAPKGLRVFWPFGNIWRPVAVMVASLVLGVYFGFAATAIDQADINQEIETMIMG